MSRLDQHVANVRNKLTLQYFTQGLAWSLTGAATVVIAVIALNRLLAFRIPLEHGREWALLGATGAAVALAWALMRRPSAAAAAVRIDQELKLKEKFSTALYVRSSNDPFCQAAVRDAENTAQNVKLHKQFPLSFPRGGAWACAAVLAAWCCFLWLPQCDFLGRQARAEEKKTSEARALAQTKLPVQQGIATVVGLPKIANENAEIKALKQSLEDIIQNPTASDPAKDNRKAVETLDKLNKALAAEQEKVAKYAEEQKLAMNATMAPTDDAGPIADAQNDIRKGAFAEAAKKLEEAGKNFEKMDANEQKKTIDQMNKLTQQLANAANDPQVQQKALDQLQKAGMDKDQAQQVMDKIKQAAAAPNDSKAQAQAQAAAKQAQAQLQNQLAQLQQQAAQGNQAAAAQAQQLQGQLQQMQAAISQAQAGANAQAQANAMSQGAQSMGQAMQQQAGQNQGASGNGQQQQMAQGQQSMQNALAQLDMAQQDAQQLANAQQGAQQAQQQACQGGQCAQQGGQQGGQQGNRPGPGAAGQWAAGDPNQQGKGSGGPGIGNGLRPNNETATPFNVDKEKDVAGDSKDGRILASTLIHTKAEKGQSTLTLQDVARSAEQNATGEIDPEHISGQAKKALIEYFKTMREEPAK